jgi:hypothetical protein
MLVGGSSGRAARSEAGDEPFQLFALFWKSGFQLFQMAPHPREFFGQQRQADQDENPTLDDGQKTADDAEEQKKDAEGYHHAGTDAPDHDGILANQAKG